MEKTKYKDLLQNIECEYKYALHEDYVDEFMQLFCEHFNDLVDQVFVVSNAPQVQELLAEKDSFKISVDQFVEQHLANEYFDTENDELFKLMHSGLRIRRSSLTQGIEQTLKIQCNVTGISHSHLEYNVKSQEDLKIPNLSLFDPKIFPDHVDINELQPRLVAKYKTDFIRKSLLITIPCFASFELCIDQGEVSDGTNSSKVNEVEIEIMSISDVYLDYKFGHSVTDFHDIQFEMSDFINQILLDINEDFSNRFNEFKKAEFISNYGEEVASSYVYRHYGLVGLEPFSKLKRAVLLAASNNAYNKYLALKDKYEQEIKEDESLSVKEKNDFKLEMEKAQFEHFKYSRVNINGLKSALVEYLNKDNTTVEDFSQMIFIMVDKYNEAVGFANLYGTPENFDDLATCLRVFRIFADKVKTIGLDSQAKSLYDIVRQDPDLRDLSMLGSIENYETYIYLNTAIWFNRFYKELLVALSSEEVEDSASFKHFCMSAVKGAFILKSSEVMEHVIYMIDKLKVVLNSDKEHFKEQALAMQEHINIAWEKLKEDEKEVYNLKS